MKTKALALIEGKILMSRRSAHKIGMIAGLAPDFKYAHNRKSNYFLILAINQ
jgi:hypothetical protein